MEIYVTTDIYDYIEELNYVEEEIWKSLLSTLCTSSIIPLQPDSIINGIMLDGSGKQ